VERGREAKGKAGRQRGSQGRRRDVGKDGRVGWGSREDRKRGRETRREAGREVRKKKDRQKENE